MNTGFWANVALITITVLLVAAAAVRGVWSPCGLSMISAINPLSERARGHRYWLTVVWFVVGAVVGGAALGLLGAAGAVLFAGLGVAATVPVAGLCCLVTLAADVPSVRFRLPLIPRQVNERWLSGYRRWFYAAGFGAQIGIGLATYVMTAAVYLVPVLGALSGSASFAFVIGVLFGLVRGLGMLLTVRVRTPSALLDLHRALANAEPWSRRVAMLVQASAALLFAYFTGAVASLLMLGLILWGALHARRQTSRVRRRSPVPVGGSPASSAADAARW